MKKPHKSSFPMAVEGMADLAHEFSEFGYRETDDPDEADRRGYYKVEVGRRRAACRGAPLRQQRPVEGQSHVCRLEGGSAEGALFAPSGYHGAGALADTILSSPLPHHLCERYA
jgi:hypothetical protein